MDRRNVFIFVTLLLVFIAIEAVTVRGEGEGNKGEGNGNGNKGEGSGNNGNGNGNNGNGNGNNGNGNGDGNGGNGNNGNGNGNNGNNANTPPPAYPPDQSAISDSERLPPVPGTGQEQAICRSIGACNGKILTCPSQCTERKPSLNKEKGCFIDCSSKCEATCRSRRPSCDGLGSVCYDPRFVGGDGMMFYFHGQKGSDFALVSDKNLQINAHFIGTRPAGRTRDFTWVQAIAIMFDSHTLVIAAKKVSHWDTNVDALALKWDGKSISIPTEGETEWRTNGEDREVLIERTDATNTIRVTVSGLVEVDVKVTPIGEQENKVHNYQLPSDDAFAHLETQIRYLNVSDSAEGILGKTYRSDYVSPVKGGVAMPTMSGEDKYQTPSLYSPSCKSCMFQRPSGIAII